MGRVRHEWNTPKKSRYWGLVEKGYSQRHAAQELEIKWGTALKWKEGSDRRTRLTSAKQLGRPRTITDEYISQMITWITGHYDRRILLLTTIAREAYGIKNALYRTLIRAQARWGYYQHLPDSKTYLTKA